jgi:carbon storage regulator
MLVLTRKLNQTIVIQDNIRVKIVEIADGSVKIGIDAPKEILIYREEVFEEIQKENRRAAELPHGLNLNDLIKGN